MIENLFSQETLQELFEFDFNELLEADHADLKYIEQSHYGDMLIEVNNDGNEHYKLWANYDGEHITGVEVEYCGAVNKYSWNTVFEI